MSEEEGFSESLDPVELLAAEQEQVLDPEHPRLVQDFLRRTWRKLVTPTQRKPIEYADRRLARIVNESLDAGPQGAAHKALVGESLSLVANHLATERVGAQTPLGHLAGSVGEFAWIKWDKRKEGKP